MSSRSNCGIGYRWALPLAVFGVFALSTPAVALEREGPVVYFSLEDLQLDLQHILHHDTLPSVIPPMNWQTLQPDQQQSENGPIERSMRSGNDQGIDGYRLPGMRLLWGH